MNFKLTNYLASEEADRPLDDLMEVTQLDVVARHSLGDEATAPVDLITRCQAGRAIAAVDTVFAVADALERDVDHGSEKREP